MPVHVISCSEFAMIGSEYCLGSTDLRTQICDPEERKNIVRYESNGWTGHFDRGQRSRPDVLASGCKYVLRVFRGFFFFFETRTIADSAVGILVLCTRHKTSDATATGPG